MIWAQGLQELLPLFLMTCAKHFETGPRKTVYISHHRQDIGACSLASFTSVLDGREIRCLLVKPMRAAAERAGLSPLRFHAYGYLTDCREIRCLLVAEVGADLPRFERRGFTVACNTPSSCSPPPHFSGQIHVFIWQFRMKSVECRNRFLLISHSSYNRIDLLIIRAINVDMSLE